MPIKRERILSDSPEPGPGQTNEPSTAVLDLRSPSPGPLSPSYKEAALEDYQYDSADSCIDDDDHLYHVLRYTQLCVPGQPMYIKDEAVCGTFATLYEANNCVRHTLLTDRTEASFRSYGIENAGDGSIELAAEVSDMATIMVSVQTQEWKERPPKEGETGEVWVVTEEGENMGTYRSRVGATKALKRWLVEKELKNDDEEVLYILSQDGLVGSKLVGDSRMGVSFGAPRAGGEDGKWVRKELIQAVRWNVTC